MSLGSSTNQYNNQRMLNAATAPEDVFIAWLLSRPSGADLVSAAKREITKLEASAARHPGAKRLYDLFHALIMEKQASNRPSVSQTAQ